MSPMMITSTSAFCPADPARPRFSHALQLRVCENGEQKRACAAAAQRRKSRVYAVNAFTALMAEARQRRTKGAAFVQIVLSFFA